MRLSVTDVSINTIESRKKSVESCSSWSDRPGIGAATCPATVTLLFSLLITYGDALLSL